LQGLPILVTFVTIRKRSDPEETALKPSEFKLEEFLPYRLSVLTNTVSQGIARGYRQHHDISVTEWRILAVLGRFPGLTASEVAARTAMDKVAISRSVKSLEEKALLQRGTDRGDRRRQPLYLTPDKGDALLHQVIPSALRYEHSLLQALTPAEQATLSTLLARLQRQAETL
jgi:DNA-binding MarR family transcriptional regulator